MLSAGGGLNTASFQSGNIISKHKIERVWARLVAFPDYSEFSGPGTTVVSLLSDMMRILRGVGKATDGSTCLLAALWVFTAFEYGMNIGFGSLRFASLRVAPSHTSHIISPFAFTKLSLSTAWRPLVMKGVLCFNNGQHRTSNSSGRVETRNIYFVRPPVSNRIGTIHADVRTSSMNVPWFRDIGGVLF